MNIVVQLQINSFTIAANNNNMMATTLSILEKVLCAVVVFFWGGGIWELGKNILSNNRENHFASLFTISHIPIYKRCAKHSIIYIVQLCFRFRYYTNQIREEKNKKYVNGLAWTRRTFSHQSTWILRGIKLIWNVFYSIFEFLDGLQYIFTAIARWIL